MRESEDHIEVEWQFDADDLGAVERWLCALPVSLAVAVTAAELDEHTDTYFDTIDWRVYRSGYALRLRRSQHRAELTLKALGSSRSGHNRRREITQSVVNGGPETIDQLRGPVGDRVMAIRGLNHALPLFSATTQRKRFRLWRDGQEIGDLSLDSTSYISESVEDRFQLKRVEIETAGEQSDHLKSLVDAIAAACDLRPASASKFETGVSVFGLQPHDPVNVGSLAFDRESSIDGVAVAVLRRHFIALVRHEPGTRLGDDVEELHDMRVAARRLRAALALFSPYLSPQLTSIREDLRWIASALGEVRDLDVQLAEIRGWKERLDPRDSAALDPLLSEYDRRRNTARERMLSLLDSERYERFVAEFTDRLKEGAGSDNSGYAVDVLPELILPRLKKFRRRADRLRASSENEAFHRVRIDGKRLRYALEFVSPLYGKAVRDFIPPLIAVQDLLGRHQDSIVAVEHLRGIASDRSIGLPPATLFAMGRIAEGYAGVAAASRDGFPKAYKRLTGTRLERLERELRRGSRRQSSKADRAIE